MLFCCFSRVFGEGVRWVVLNRLIFGVGLVRFISGFGS